MMASSILWLKKLRLRKPVIKKKKKGLFTPVFVTPKPFVQCGVLGDTLRDNRERGM